MYGSSFWRVVRSPRDLKRRPREAVVMPLPRPEATPPVTKMYFGCVVTSGGHANRAPRRLPGFGPNSVGSGRLFPIGRASRTIEPPKGRGGVDRPGESDGLGRHVQSDAD